MKMKTPPSIPHFARSHLLLLAAGWIAILLTGCGDRGSEQTHDDHSNHGGDEKAGMAGFIGINHSHNDRQETCFICDASKRDEGRLWCKEHGRYEDRCWMCHPELEDENRLYCREHALYEDECYLCHPELKEAEASEPTTQTDVPKPTQERGLFCNEHGVYEKECGICQPDLAASLQPGESLKVRFPSAQAAGKAGIGLRSPVPAELSPAISVFCESRYNQNALAKITPLVDDGVVDKVHRDLGDRVKAGEPLVQIHSSKVADAKSAYLSALVQLDIAEQTYQRLKRLDEEKIAAEKDLIAARGAFRSAEFEANRSRQRLNNLGMSDESIRAVEKTQDASALLTIRAPFDGTLVERQAVPGEAVGAGHSLFTLAELSRFWVELSVPPNHLATIRPGQTVEATFADLGEEPFTGRIVWIDSSIDPQSRMVRARAVVEPDGRPMTAGLFGKANIVIGDRQPGTLLPREAVQRHEGKDFVFVREADDLYALRRVELGAQSNGQVEVLRGLSADESVVVTGSFIAMSEFLKFRLGAGCVH